MKYCAFHTDINSSEPFTQDLPQRTIKKPHCYRHRLRLLKQYIKSIADNDDEFCIKCIKSYYMLQIKGLIWQKSGWILKYSQNLGGTSVVHEKTRHFAGKLNTQFYVFKPRFSKLCDMQKIKFTFIWLPAVRNDSCGCGHLDAGCLSCCSEPVSAWCHWSLWVWWVSVGYAVWQLNASLIYL